MNFRKTTAFFVAVITCLFFFGMTGAMAAEPYNLGVALGLTGAGALYSADGVEGIKLAVEEINAKGGLLGQHKIELFIRDSQTKPDVGVREVKDLILRDKIRAVINDYSSAVAMAVKPIAQEYKVLHIASISNSENITMINPSPYTFQVVPNSYMQAKAAAVAIAKMAKQKGWKEFITIASDYEWGRSTQASAVKFLKETSPDLILKKEFWPRLGETQFTSYITGIMAMKPDFVLGSVASNDNVAWMEQAKTLRFLRQDPLSRLADHRDGADAAGKDAHPRYHRTHQGTVFCAHGQPDDGRFR